ncbi:hypothetical protein RND81_08G155600 [Saponaria officinalis]|uniref:Symplekin n=1 Tax=Saponaria officinalis TaxID=3572 RepID=A0AAW1J7T1_SAPOF
MVELMEVDSLARVTSLIDSVTFAINDHSKLENLNLLKHELPHEENDVEFISRFLPSLLKLISDRFSPIRKCVTEVLSEIGLRHVEFLPKIIPSLLIVVDDDTPAVGRQAITSGTSIFCCALEKIALQELNMAEQTDLLESTWTSMQRLKEKIYSIAFQSESDGRRLLALKFIAAVILIYTPDPNGGTDQPSRVVGDDKEVGFSISWLRRGHPILKLGDLSIEASQSLGLLLDQLRPPIVKSLSTSMVVILINCLSAIAIKRPSFYGRILPVLLGLDPSNSVIKGLHAYGVQHALKNAFLSCLKCAHPSAMPWRDRLVGALRDMKAGALAEEIIGESCNGNVKEEKINYVAVKEEPSVEVHDSVGKKMGRKRSSEQDYGERSEDDDTPGKRARSTSTASEELNIESEVNCSVEVKPDPTAQATTSERDDLGPVQQLIGLFGALVAQGGKAAASLEILIAGISADLLAEVVIANLRNLPSTCPVADEDEKPFGKSKVDSDMPFRQLSSFLMDAVSRKSSQNMSSAAEAPTSDDIESQHMEESPAEDLSINVTENDVVNASSIDLTEKVPSDVPFDEPSASHLSIVSEFQDMGTPPDAVIPGLDDTRSDGLPVTVKSSSLNSTELDDFSQDLVSSTGIIPKSESLPSMSTERSEELTSKTTVVDSNAGIASTATSVGPIPQLVLPKLSAPVVELSDEDKDTLQKSVFVRILEAYKQVAVAGGSQLRFSVLASLGVEYPLELDCWTVLQTHILSDYMNHEGHELTLQVLYRLYGEAEEERDFFSSTTASSVYETFLLKVSETLRDSFPASDKSLSRLLGEVPYLPKSVLNLLECLCSPVHGDKDEKELHNGDRVTQGLSAVWSLILLRPNLRNSLLRIALQSAVHHMEEVRMKAIRLVANKLYPLPSAVLQIEEFAKDMLVSIVDGSSVDTLENEKSSMQSQKNFDNAAASNDQAHTTSACNTHSRTPESISSTSLSEAQRCMSLYFALCTKKHALLRQVFAIYKSSPDSVKQAIDGHMPILIRTMGSSPSLLEIISDPPDGSESLLIQVLHTLTEGKVPSAELIFTIKKLYELKMKNVEILFPILSSLPKEECSAYQILRVFPQVVNLPQEKFQAALSRLLQGSTPSGPLLTPAEVLIAIHSIDPDKDGIPLKKVTDACNSCFERKQIFTQQVIAKVLNHLVEQIPLPLLFMRTVLQAIGAFPALVDFIMEILSRLVNKQIWKNPKLWVGFLKCAQLTQPHSFNVLLQLPQAQLEGALKKMGALKAPLATHASQPNVKATLPRSILVVLGIASDPQVESHSQAGQPEVVDASNSEKDNNTEKTKESSGGG